MDSNKLTDMLTQLATIEKELTVDLNSKLDNMSKEDRKKFDDEISSNPVFKEALKNMGI